MSCIFEFDLMPNKVCYVVIYDKMKCRRQNSLSYRKSREIVKRGGENHTLNI